MDQLRSASALTDVATTGRGRITVWADASEQWSVLHTVVASIVQSGPVDIDIAAIVSDSHVTAVPLPIVEGPPTDVLDALGGVRPRPPQQRPSNAAPSALVGGVGQRRRRYCAWWLHRRG